jgi:CubicO group peptidase (beta-lactamase class C family)
LNEEIAPEAWMQGFPPEKDRVVRFADGSYYGWPQLRWSFSNIQQLVPTKSVWRGDQAVRPLQSGPQLDFSTHDLTTLDGRTLSVEQALLETCTDGLAVMKSGKLVYERYFGACEPLKPHILQSANKSLVGTVAECLIRDGKLSNDSPVTDLIPELKGSAWAGATVRQVMDMQIGMAFHEDYADPNSEIWKFTKAMGMAPPAPGEIPDSISEVLQRIKQEGDHGERFAYREPNIFVLGWIVRRAASQDLASIVAEKIWQHLGAERDAYYMLDNCGTETTCCTTLRDLLRFGKLVNDGGMVDGQSVIPADVFDHISLGGDTRKFALAQMPNLEGWSYRSQWWIRHIDGRTCLVARGAHGQVLYVDPTNNLVVARFGSSRKPASTLLDPVLLPMIDFITAQTSE